MIGERDYLTLAALRERFFLGGDFLKNPVDNIGGSSSFQTNHVVEQDAMFQDRMEYILDILKRAEGSSLT